MLTSDQPAPSGGTVNKTELAAILKTSLPTLDKLIREHGPAFPIVTRGTNGKSYSFDPAAVTAFLQSLEDARQAAGRAKDELMQQYTLPGVTDPEEARLTPGERVQLAKLREMERREKIEAGFLAEKSAVRAALFSAFATLRRDMRAAVRTSLRDANIPETVIRAVEARIDEAQRTFVATAKAALSETDYTHGEQPEPALL